MVKICQGWGARFGVAAGAMRGVMSCGVASLLAFSGDQVLAQVTSDGTLPTNIQVGADGITYNITGGSPVGTNVFHSFGIFSVPAGGSANFTDVAGFTNIFGRVTGGTPSYIQGTIRAVGSANLFLINPSGIIFGPNAQLNIGGSFVGTTANAIRFRGGGEFSMTSAVEPNNSVLALNPSALFFNQTPAGAIVNQSIAPNSTDPSLKDGLRVPDGQNLFLVGGDVRLENGGTVRALGGRIELGGLAGTGEVKIEELTTGSNPQLNFPNVRLTFPEGVARANVSLTNGAIVDVVALGGGDIAINAQNIDVSGDSFVCAGLGTTASSCGTPSTSFGSSNPKAGNIAIDATGVVNVRQSRIENNVNPGATGNSDNIFDVIASENYSNLFGSILISTGSLSITEGASVSTSTFGNGNAGLVFVDASDSVSVSGYRGEQRSRIASAVVKGAVGDAGGILIRTGSLSLTDYSLLNSSTAGIGNAGAVVVEANGAVSLVNDSVIFNNVEAGGKGASGLIDITAESLSLLNGSQLQTLVRDVESGSAGNVKINVRDTVTISGVGNPAFGNQGEALPSAIFSSVGSGVNGNAGNIQISTGSLSLSDRGQINTDLDGTGTPGSIYLEATDSISLTNDAKIKSVIGEDAVATSSDNPFSNEVSDSFENQTTGGKTGTILISTGGLSINNNSFIDASTFGQGDAGSVIVAADGTVSLTNGGRIYSRVEPTGTGNAGGIFMAVESLTIEGTPDNPSGLTTSALGVGQGNPGIIWALADKDITIKGGADEDVPIQDGQRSGILSRVGPETATGDTNDTGILLTGESIFLKDGATVNVDNDGIGTAGNIIILARDLILNNQGKVTAASASGKGGEIIIAGDLILNNSASDTDGTIILLPGDFVLLLRNSEISTLAGSADRPGSINGGDITISTRYLITAPARSNDLDAEAFGGVGGRIEITADRLYDIRERSLSRLTNDISATSGFGPPGQVTSTVLNVDPTQGLSNLPANPIDPSTLMAETCAPRGNIADRPKNQFINTGPGGLPPDPNAAFTGEAVVNELEPETETEENNTDSPSSTNPENPVPAVTTSPQEPERVEAQGWVYGKNGDIIFTAQAPTVTPTHPTLTPASTCNDF
ncbi:MAG TPA: filamentous hemagglutinin N-terminal domain-containing protein [Stenomitos sp.]